MQRWPQFLIHPFYILATLLIQIIHRRIIWVIHPKLATNLPLIGQALRWHIEHNTRISLKFRLFWLYFNRLILVALVVPALILVVDRPGVFLILILFDGLELLVFNVSFLEEFIGCNRVANCHLWVPKTFAGEWDGLIQGLLSEQLFGDKLVKHLLSLILWAEIPVEDKCLEHFWLDGRVKVWRHEGCI